MVSRERQRDAKRITMVEMEELALELHSPSIASTPRHDFSGKPEYLSLGESFLEDSVVEVFSYSEGGNSNVNRPTRPLKRRMSDDSGLEQFSFRNGSSCHQSRRLTSDRGDADSDCCSDNVSTDSAVGQSGLSAGDISCDDEDLDTSFLGPVQAKSVLSGHGQTVTTSWSKSKHKSLSEEIAEADNTNTSNNQGHLTCRLHQDINSQLFCEVCEEMCCVECKKNDTHTGHKLTTANNVRMQRKTSLKGLTSCTKDKLDNALKQTAELRKYRAQLSQQEKHIHDELNSRRQFLHKLVDRWYDKTSFQVHTILTDEQICIDNMIQTLELHISDMKKACDESQHLINDLSDGYRLAESNDSIESLEDMNQNKLPQLDSRVNLILGSGTNITQDMFGNLSWCLSDTNTQPVRAITSGKLLWEMDTRQGYSNRHTCLAASGLSLTKDGSLVVTDIGTDMVQVFDPQGNLKLQLNTLPLQSPTKTVGLLDGTFAVACKNNVKLFSPSGEYLQDLNSDLFCPHGVAVNRNGDLVVTDMGERQACIYMYARAGHRLLNCIVGGIHAPAFHNAWNVTVGRDDHLIVSDYAEHCIKIFTPNGLLACEFGQKGAGIGQFFHPAGTCVDPYGNILVADSANHRVQMFSPTGEFLAVLICDDSLVSPMDVAVNDMSQLLVLQGNGEVKVYSYTR